MFIPCMQQRELRSASQHGSVWGCCPAGAVTLEPKAWVGEHARVQGTSVDQTLERASHRTVKEVRLACCLRFVLAEPYDLC